MGRRKKTPFRDYETGSTDVTDGGGQYTRITKALLDAPAIQGLSGNAFKLYVYMCLRCAAKQEFTYTAGQAEKDGFNRATYWKALKELEAGGFVQVMHQGKTRKANKLTWITVWKAKK